jgi:hypothetical protein
MGTTCTKECVHDKCSTCTHECSPEKCEEWGPSRCWHGEEEIDLDFDDADLPRLGLEEKVDLDFDDAETTTPCSDSTSADDADFPRLGLEPRVPKIILAKRSPEHLTLELTFDVDGKVRRVLLDRRPLGAEYAKQGLSGPTKISKIQPKSYASELGMQPGWIIKSVGSEDVSKKTHKQRLDAIQKGLSTLPMRMPMKK